jgi:hypothetical protein
MLIITIWIKGSIPISILIEPTQLTITKKWFPTLLRETVIRREVIKNIKLVITNMKPSFAGSIVVFDGYDKKTIIYFCTNYTNSEIENDTKPLVLAISQILSITVDCAKNSE